MSLSVPFHIVNGIVVQISWVQRQETNRLSILLLVLQAADVFLFLTDIRKRKKMERNLMSVEQESKRYKL